jgi:cyclophilin family peptidyl-prolyl cis-trans isomerase
MKRLFLAALSLAVLAGAARAADKNPVVEVDTNYGKFKVELFQDKAPETVKNFLAYVDSKFYDNTIFHRVMSNFMIQGGGIDAETKKEKQTGKPIKNESANGLSNKKYTIAMARTNAPDSATSQFFISVKDNDRLDKANYPDGVGYCVFGKVTDGTDVVDKIRDVETKPNERGEKAIPVKDVVIKSIRRVEEKKDK